MTQDASSKMTPLANVYKEAWIGDVALAIGIAFFIFLIASIIWMANDNAGNKKGIAVLLGAIFALAPPVYFFFEVYLFREFGVQEQWEHFKYLQETAAKLWAAGLAVLYAVYSKTFPGKA